jgi:hypothetical protein
MAALFTVLSAGPPVHLSAQSIAVVANASFRPTAVLGPHVRYVAAVDSETGQLSVRGLAVPPVAFGTLRVEGVQPFARVGPPRSFDDTVRFEPDGRVVLLRADERGRPPIAVEVQGARGVPGGRITITASRWPLGRVLLVTITPADIYEMGWASVGFGVRDRIRVDDRLGMAYLQDSTTGRTTVAVGFGRGASGRIQGDLASVVLVRDFGGETGIERRQVGALVFAIDPAHDEEGNAHAELVFGVGDNEAEAAQAARAAGAETVTAPGAARLQLRTPSADVGLALRHVLAATAWQLDWDLVAGARTMPALAVRPAVRIVDAWRAAPVALHFGDGAAVCGSYRVLRAGTTPASGPHAEVALRLGPNGRYLGAADSAVRGADAGIILLGYACYRASRNASWLAAEMPALVAASTRLSRDIADPLLPEALRRLAEIDDELVRVSAGQRPASGDSLRTFAAELEGTRSIVTPNEAWRTVTGEAGRALTRDYGRMAGAADPGGLSLTAAGSFVDAIGRGLFGIDEHLDRVDIMPRLEGLADDQTWEISGWLIGPGDTLALTYRPFDRAAVIRIAAARRWRLGLRFPWLTPTSCVTARRAGEIERMMLVMLNDGTGYVDVRATFDPAQIRVSADACS